MAGCLFAASVLGISADWKTQSFPNWDEEAVLRLVTDSPWAKQRTVRMEWRNRIEIPFSYKDVPGADHSNQPLPGSPVGGIGGGVQRSHLPEKADLIIRWASALPVRQAKALYRHREEKKDLQELIGAGDSDYVVEIYGVPALVAHQGTGTVESVVKQSAWLQTKSRKMRPSRVEATVHGGDLTVMVHFAKSPAIEVGDQTVDFSADFQIFAVREKFKLSAMMYGNRLEL